MNNAAYLFDQYKHVLNAEVITKYTNALYDTDDRPTYDEFRDMFSTGQVLSKLWAISELDNIGFEKAIDSVIIAGAWYGSLGMMIHQMWPNYKIKLLDIDVNCMLVLDKIIYDIGNISSITKDMYAYDYNEDLIINTSCEHIPNLQKWISLIPSEKLVLLQSNNCDTIPGHMNCVHSINQFKEQANLSSVLYAASFDLGMYTRYMIIGLT